MAACDHQHLADSVKRMITDKCAHHYVHQYIESPVVDEDHILMMSAAMDQSVMAEEERIAAASAAMFVQIALDTHEKVSDPAMTLKQRQLTVLAGDYYSGVYYQILSEIENIGLIQKMANAIKEINEQKISLWESDVLNADDFLERCKKIETSVMVDFCRFFDANSYIGLFSDYIFINRLIEEIVHLKNGVSTLLLSGLFRLVYPKATLNQEDMTPESVAADVEQLIKEQIRKLEYNIERAMQDQLILPPLLLSRIQEKCSSYLGLKMGER